MCQPHQEADQLLAQFAGYVGPLDLGGDIGERPAEHQLGQDHDARPRDQHGAAGRHTHIAGDIAGAVADAHHADALAHEGLRLPVVMRMQVAIAECLKLRHVQRRGQVAGCQQHGIESLDGAAGQFDVPNRGLAGWIERRTDGNDAAVEADSRGDAEMTGVLHQIAVHVVVVREWLGIGIEIQVAEPGHAAGGVDVQRAIGRGPAAVIVVAPHTADLAADLEHRDIESGLQQVFGVAQAAGPGPDDGDPLGASAVWTHRWAIQATLIDGLDVGHGGGSGGFPGVCVSLAGAMPQGPGRSGGGGR
ncbi:hypothetical protein GALL_554400 [mine drainage metagenome]|uniref:Uncharacterized protein n=1 Tax=mine drainage metagenome TaxID=410659 RepID=A0A1J5NV01_9ZZZZ